MKKHILLVLVSIVLVMILCSCSSSPQQQQAGGISKGAAVSDGKGSPKSFSYPPQVDSSRNSPEKALQSQFVSQNQAFTLKSSASSYPYQFTFQLKSTTVSKKLTGFQKADIDFGCLDYLKATVDASGNLTGEGSYVYLDFMVKNMLPKEAKIDLLNIKIVSLSADNTVNVKLGSSLHAFDKPQHDKSSRDIYLYKFQANEETTFRMLYIVPDTGLKTNLCLEVDPSGIYGNHGQKEDCEAKRFIKLGLT